MNVTPVGRSMPPLEVGDAVTISGVQRPGASLATLVRRARHLGGRGRKGRRAIRRLARGDFHSPMAGSWRVTAVTATSFELGLAAPGIRVPFTLVGLPAAPAWPRWAKGSVTHGLRAYAAANRYDGPMVRTPPGIGKYLVRLTPDGPELLDAAGEKLPPYHDGGFGCWVMGCSWHDHLAVRGLEPDPSPVPRQVCRSHGPSCEDTHCVHWRDWGREAGVTPTLYGPPT